ncbi:MAG: hypothetical protein WCH77_09110 [Planctomycetota bacterium]
MQRDRAIAWLNPLQAAQCGTTSGLFAGDDLDPNGWTDEFLAQDTRGNRKDGQATQ